MIQGSLEVKLPIYGKLIKVAAGSPEEETSERKRCQDRCACGVKDTNGRSAVFFNSLALEEHIAVARSTFGSEDRNKLSVSEHFGISNFQKVHAAVARSTICKSKLQKTPNVDTCCWMFAFCMAGARGL